MTDLSPSEHDLKRENADLRLRLSEAEDVIRALRAGEVDALVVSAPEGPKVYTLEGADRSYRVIIEQMVRGAATLTPDGIVLYCNPRFAEIVGQPLEKVIGASVAPYMQPADLARLSHESLSQTGGIANLESVMTRADGTAVPVSLSINDLSAYDLSAVCLLVGDLTEEKRTQRLLASAKLTNAILEQAGDAIIVTDAEGLVIRANAAAQRLCDCDPLRMPFEIALPLHFAPLPQGPTPEISAAMLRQKALSGVQVVYEGLSGERFELLLNSNPLTGDDGETIGAVVTLANTTDLVTARALAEELAETAQRHAAELDAVLDTIPDGLVIYGPGSEVLRVNSAAERMMGFTAEQLSRPWHERLPLVDLRLASGEPLAKESAPSMRALRGETVTDQLMRGRRADGSDLWLSFSAAPVWNAGGEIVASVATFKDVTPLLAAQEELRRHRDQLQEMVSEAMDELRTLSAQVLHAEEAERRRIAEGVHDDISQTLAFSKLKLQMLRQAAVNDATAGEFDQMIDLMTKVIEYTRDLTFDLSPPVLFELGLVPAMEWLADALDRQHGLCVEIVGDDAPLPLSPDAAIVVFRSSRELLMNVLKHSGTNAARVAVSRAGGAAQVVVSDQGQGFHRPEPSRAEAAGGGFGLSSIRERMGYIGGTMDVASAPRKGTTVTLTAPLDRASCE